MDFYTIFKFLHVLTALAWVGGGLTMLMQSIFSIHDKGELETIRSLNAIASMGQRWFIPASLLTVIFGAATTFLGNLWGELWVILGLVGFASTFLTGMLVFEPRGKAMGEAMKAGDEAEALRQGRALLRASKFDYTVMFLVVADMVLKPGYTDFVLLGLMAVVLAGGAVLFLAPALRNEPAAA